MLLRMFTSGREDCRLSGAGGAFLVLGLEKLVADGGGLTCDEMESSAGRCAVLAVTGDIGGVAT